MAVRITEDFVPVEDPTVFSAAFHTGGHCFASVTMDMVRDIINKEANARAADAGHRPISKFHDPRRVLDLMEWWNDLPTTERAMPWFKTSHSTYDRIVEMKNLCHVCHNKLPNVQVAASAPAPPLRLVCTCPAAGTELYQQVAAIVRRDFERFDSMSFYYYTALGNHSDLQGKLKALEQRSPSPAWIKALNAELGRYLGCKFLGDPSLCGPADIAVPLDHAMPQMQAFYLLSTMKPPRGLPVLARLQALNVAKAENKQALQWTLHEYLNHVKPFYSHRPTPLTWTPQPHLLRQALYAIERYERGMQCTQLALVVKSLLPRDSHKKVDNAMYIVATLVHPYLGPPVPEQYNKGYVKKWWNISLR